MIFLCITISENLCYNCVDNLKTYANASLTVQCFFSHEYKRCHITLITITITVIMLTETLNQAKNVHSNMLIWQHYIGPRNSQNK